MFPEREDVGEIEKVGAVAMSASAALETNSKISARRAGRIFRGDLSIASVPPKPMNCFDPSA